MTQDRIISLDVLRGFALLGILIMNIQVFSMPMAAYLNPMAYGDFSRVNQVAWIVSHILADQKFLSIFSLLFGVGICIFSERAEAKQGRSASLHYRRTFWLLCFGLIHGHFLWQGDILYSYALCGFWVYLLRKRSARALCLLGILIFSVSSLIYVFAGMMVPHMPPEMIAAMEQTWDPGPEDIQDNLAAYRGNWIEQMAQRHEQALDMETFYFFTTVLWRAGGMMLIGMALYKWGIFSAAKTYSFYLTLGAPGFLIGLSLVALGLLQNFAHEFSMEFSMFFGSQFNYWGSAFVSLGYVAAVMLFVKKGRYPGLQHRLAAVGQMAFSNYIFHTLVCTTIFYGFGLGLFGQVERMNQLFMVFAIWLVQLWYSPLWLQNFRYGPLEWAWRSLTYLRLQPFVKEGKGALKV